MNITFISNTTHPIMENLEVSLDNYQSQLQCYKYTTISSFINKIVLNNIKIDRLLLFDCHTIEPVIIEYLLKYNIHTTLVYTHQKLNLNRLYNKLFIYVNETYYIDTNSSNKLLNMVLDGVNGSFLLDIDKIESSNVIDYSITQEQIIENLQIWMMNLDSNYNCQEIDLVTARIQLILPLVVNTTNPHIKKQATLRLIQSIDTNIRCLDKILFLLEILKDKENMNFLLRNADNYINQYLQNKTNHKHMRTIHTLTEILNIDIENKKAVVLNDLPNSLKILVGCTNTLSRFWELLPFAYFRNEKIFNEMIQIYFHYRDILDNIIQLDFLEYYIKKPYKTNTELQFIFDIGAISHFKYSAHLLLKQHLDLMINIEDYYKYLEYNLEFDFLDEYYLSNDSRFIQLGYHITHLIYNPTLYGIVEIQHYNKQLLIDKCQQFFLKTLDKVKTLDFDLYLEYIHCLHIIGYRGNELEIGYQIVRETYFNNLVLDTNANGSINNPELKPEPITDFFSINRSLRSHCDILYKYTHPTVVYLTAGSFSNLITDIDLTQYELHQNFKLENTIQKNTILE